MERICTKCGSPIDDGDLFCDICGAEYKDNDTDADAKALTSEEHNEEQAQENEIVSEEKADPVNKQMSPVLCFVNKHKEKVIFVAVALAVLIAALITVNIITANTPEATLKKALEYRITGNVNGSVSVDYESNFSKTESKSDMLNRLKGNTDLTLKRNSAIKIKITAETRVQDDKAANTTDFTNRVNDLSANYKDTDKITDIRNMTYELIDGDEVKMSGTAQAIKVYGKWYIFGVAQAALTF